jgi:anti-sigma28 factor (negative regulator of flagellin synthesis)
MPGSVMSMVEVSLRRKERPRMALKVFNGSPIVELQGERSGEGIGMRIDLNTSVGQTSDPGEVSKSGRRSSTDSSGESAADVLNLSYDGAGVQGLAELVGQMPEIRQQRVSALADTIGSGTYAVTAEQTADAMTSYMAGGA